MKLSTKVIGALGFGFLVVFLIRGKKEGESVTPIQGLNMNVNPNLIVDSVMPYTKIPKHYQNQLGNGIKKFIYGYMNEQGS
jgi:hypothetical protein